MLLYREKFVAICKQAILNTRHKITITNQESGYIKFHREIKENNYFENTRRLLNESSPGDYMYLHDLIEHTGLGNCRELAEFLLVEISREIDHNNACARINLVKSARVDHVYLEIKIQLAGEMDYSRWEVDAWDPRIIDISTRPDGSIKNYELLGYGYSTILKDSIYSDQIDYSKRYGFFEKIPKPQAGRPHGNATPKRDVLKYHSNFYTDYTIKEAIESEKLPKTSEEITYLQEASSWQLKRHFG